MPSEMVDFFGFVLRMAQTGKKHEQANHLKGFGGASVLEVVVDHMGDTYRAIYTVKIGNSVYVLHCYQKKVNMASKRQSKTRTRFGTFEGCTSARQRS